MADGADGAGATGAGNANTPPSPGPASVTLGDVDVDLLGPLERAAGTGDAQATKAFLAAGPAVYCKAFAAEGRPLRRTILHWAALGGNPDVVELVLQAMISIFVGEPEEGDCPHEYMAVSSDTINAALNATCLSEADGPDGTTPLHFAAEYGQTPAVVALLNHGANHYAQDGHGRTPLIVSIDAGQDEVALKLVRRGSWYSTPPISPEEEILFHRAAWRGCVRVVKLLLSRGASTGASAITDETPLMLAALSGPNAGKIIKRLLAAGGSADATDNHGRTALSFAVSSDEHPGPAIRALVAGGADPYLPSSSSGFSPLQQAALDGNGRALSAFFKLGVDPDTRHKLDDEECGGASLLDLAARRLRVAAVKRLLSAGAHDGITATALRHASVGHDRRRPVTTVPADVVGVWADQVMPALSKTKRERRSAKIRAMLARAEFVRKGWLSVLRARCDDGERLTGVESGNDGPRKARRKASSSSAASAATPAAIGGNGAFGGNGVGSVHDDGVWYGACVWIAMVPDEEIFNNVVSWL